MCHIGVTVLSWAKHTLSHELAFQADSPEELMTIESLDNNFHQPLFSVSTANTAIMKQ